MKQLLALFSLVAFSAQATQVLVAPPSVDPQEYRGALIAMDQMISPTEWHLRSTPEIESVEALTSAYARAEQAFIQSAEVAEAIPLFEAVIALENKDDWDSSQRKLLLTAYLRLLQIDQDPQNAKRKTWIQKALLLMNQTEVPLDLVPPSLVRELELYNSTWPKKSWEFSESVRAQFSQVLILGQKYSTSEVIQLPEFPGKVRVTLISDLRPPRTQEMDPQDSKNLNVEEESFVSGKCGSWNVNPTAALGVKPQIYVPRSCGGGTAPKEVASKPVEMPFETPRTKTSWKMADKKWLWIGLGVVATALVIHQSTQKKDAPPTESHGF